VPAAYREGIVCRLPALFAFLSSLHFSITARAHASALAETRRRRRYYFSLLEVTSAGDKEITPWVSVRRSPEQVSDVSSLSAFTSK